MDGAALFVSGALLGAVVGFFVGYAAGRRPGADPSRADFPALYKTKDIIMSPTEFSPPGGLKGYRTLLINGVLVVLPPLLNWIAGVAWTDYVSPQVAVAILGAANIGLRLVTTTPIGKSF